MSSLLCRDVYSNMFRSAFESELEGTESIDPGVMDATIEVLPLSSCTCIHSTQVYHA